MRAFFLAAALVLALAAGAAIGAQYGFASGIRFERQWCARP